MQARLQRNLGGDAAEAPNAGALRGFDHEKRAGRRREKEGGEQEGGDEARAEELHKAYVWGSEDGMEVKFAHGRGISG